MAGETVVQDKEFLERLISRKFITMNVYEITWIIMEWNGKISETTLEALTLVTLGGYFAANVFEKLKK